MSWVRNHLSDQAHWAAAKGDPESNIKYCSKGVQINEDGSESSRLDGPWRGGDTPVSIQGKRNDLVALRDGIRNNVSHKDIYDQFPVQAFKYRKGINDAKMLYKPSRDQDTFEPDIRLYVGPTATGKTSSVYKDYPDCWEPGLGDKLWFDGYDGEDTALLDDFSGQFKLVDLLKMLDRWIRRLPIKGAFVWFNPKRVIITTNIHPRSWYAGTNRDEPRREHYLALARRFTQVREYLHLDPSLGLPCSQDARDKGYVTYNTAAAVKEFFCE